MSIRTFLMEEHNEAFFIWKYAIKNGFLKKTNNTLLHIDEHSDMKPPNLNTSIHTLSDNLEDIKKFTEKELHIASFIIPAIYDQVFNKMIWVKNRHAGKITKENKLYVRSYNSNGAKLIVQRLSNLEGVSNIDDQFLQDLSPFSYSKYHIDDLPILENVVLDIDLDYFSCVQNPLEEQLKIEITKEEYQSFITNKYHRIRYFDFGRVDVEMNDNKYYYCLNNFKNRYISPLKVDKDQIILRIENVIKSLQQKEITPQIITICRSRFSGYTSKDQWLFIEEQLIKRLKEIYKLSIQPINTLYEQLEIAI